MMKTILKAVRKSFQYHYTEGEGMHAGFEQALSMTWVTRSLQAIKGLAYVVNDGVYIYFLIVCWID